MHLSPTSEIGGSNPEPHLGKIVASYRWSASYSIALDRLYVLVSSANKTTRRDVTKERIC